MGGGCAIQMIPERVAKPFASEFSAAGLSLSHERVASYLFSTGVSGFPPPPSPAPWRAHPRMGEGRGGAPRSSTEVRLLVGPQTGPGAGAEHGRAL